MAMSEDIVRVKNEHIEKGIEKYDGKLDERINSILKNHGYEFTAYRFNDDRILLVLPHNSAALLYKSEEVLFGKMDLE